MINLLPPQAKKELIAGRTNRLLLRYLLMLLAIAVITVAILAGVFVVLYNTKATEEEKLSASESSSQQLINRQQEVAAFKSDLATAKQILDKRVDYSKIILRVAAVIPDGVTISDVTLSPSSLGTPTKMNAKAKSEQHLKRLKDSLNKSKYFENAYYDTVSKESGAYPYSAVLTVTFKQELINE